MSTEQKTQVLGTVTLTKDFTTGPLSKGQILEVSKVFESPTGMRYYKLFNTKVWVSDQEVCNVNIVTVPKRRTVKIYSV